MKSYNAEAHVVIKANAARIWDALTNPAVIKKYLFGTEAVSTWKVGSPIVYRGEWNGQRYEDKGTILEIVPNKRLKSTYWSSMGGKPDLPQNYNTVTYELAENDGETTVTITQDNNPTAESAAHSKSNWESVLAVMKKLLEE